MICKLESGHIVNSELKSYVSILKHVCISCSVMSDSL